MEFTEGPCSFLLSLCAPPPPQLPLSLQIHQLQHLHHLILLSASSAPPSPPGEEHRGPPLDHVDELVDARPAALALPVRLVQEQRLEELLPQPLVLQHRHRRLREPGHTDRDILACSPGCPRCGRRSPCCW
ncbi:hypothetical protein EYF80_052496 [Liparis tanakae]|uniref:Uncharacterized protein n=1 Tax=Liparis tanakae TaxID=230148 RepID=A0A4Z2F905_9TELE|nr:hypothetical protein EYF80_052496 [Liparis tanakae]